MDFIYQKIASTWDSANPSRPTTHGYVASDEFIRLQFEEYLLALLSATKYHLYLQSVPAHNRDLSALVGVEGDPALDFGEVWLESWKASPNFKLWHKNTDSHLFDIVDPRHPTAGSLSLDDINRRVAQQIEDLHLEERFNTSKEALNKHFTSGKKQVSEVFSKAWADFEAYRIAQRAKSPPPTGFREKEDLYSMSSPPATAPLPNSQNPPSSNHSPAYFNSTSDSSTATQTPNSATAFLDSSSIRTRTPDLSSAQAAVEAASQKAGAYFSSWSSWASEKRKGWSSPASTPTSGTFTTANTNQSQENKKIMRSPRKLMIVERMRHEDSSIGNNGSRSAPAVASTYNDFRESMTQDLSDKPTNTATNTRSKNALASTPKSTVETIVNSGNPPPKTQQESVVPSTSAATEPRSPTKRGVGRGKRREEKGSDGIGRLDA